MGKVVKWDRIEENWIQDLSGKQVNVKGRGKKLTMDKGRKEIE